MEPEAHTETPHGDVVARPVHVRVRLFAALADAAGTDRTTARVATVGELRAELANRFGEVFAARLERSRAWVDGQDVDADAPLAEGVEVALLPPFAGG